MQFKKVKMTIASILMVTLTACTANNDDENRGTRNVSTGDLKHPIRNSNVLDPDRNTNVLTPTRNVSNRNPHITSNEIQQMNNGFITIDQNSYSTTMPSIQFPHSRRIQQGQYWYYRFEPEMRQPQTGMLQQPRNGAVTQPGAKAPAPPVNPPAGQPSTPSTAGINKVALQVINLTNNERKKNGLPPLQADASLSRVAQAKSNDMNAKHYFSHTSPTYGSPFDMMRDFGVTYRSAGENIAMGQSTAQQVVSAWMNSEGHRKNILSPNFTNIGVGYTQTGNYWAQMFIGK